MPDPSTARPDKGDLRAVGDHRGSVQHTRQIAHLQPKLQRVQQQGQQQQQQQQQREQQHPQQKQLLANVRASAGPSFLLSTPQQYANLLYAMAIFVTPPPSLEWLARFWAASAAPLSALPPDPQVNADMTKQTQSNMCLQSWQQASGWPPLHCCAAFHQFHTCECRHDQAEPFKPSAVQFCRGWQAFGWLLLHCCVPLLHLHGFMQACSFEPVKPVPAKVAIGFCWWTCAQMHHLALPPVPDDGALCKCTNRLCHLCWCPVHMHHLVLLHVQALPHHLALPPVPDDGALCKCIALSCCLYGPCRLCSTPCPRHRVLL
eukprot:1159273-Pelagomonas_calceolata.AAC.4